ncbi:ribosomal protein S7e [Ostertagia ostertagi]
MCSFWPSVLSYPSPSKKVPMKQKRPRFRTLTAVYEAWLDEMVFPAEVVGKRTRVKLDDKKLLEVHLDKARQTNVDHKVDTFVTVYRKLTGKEVAFEFSDSIF